MVIQTFLIVLISFLLSVLSCARLIKRSRPSKKSIPHIGGIAIWLSFTVLFILFLIFNPPLDPSLMDCVVLMVSSSMMLAVGVIDDKRELTALTQFLAQAIIACFVILLGIRTHIAGIGIVGNCLVTFLWIVGITNAFNHLDIVDGLSGGVTVICAMTFCAVSFLTGNKSLAIIFALFAGSVLGFLRYNFPTAHTYMGNAGSHFIGFVLGTLSIMISYATLERRIALLVPLIVLGLPIFDTIFVIGIRMIKGKYIWSKSDDHLTLRLVAIGYSKKIAVLCMFLFASIFSICAVTLLDASLLQSVIILVLLGMLCMGVAARMKQVIIEK